MRLLATYSDFLVITLLTCAAALVFTQDSLLPSQLTTTLGLVYLLLAPGYALTALLFPRFNDLDSVDRIALTVGLSVTLTGLTAYAFDLFPWNLGRTSIVLGLACVTLLCVLAASYRRYSLTTNLASVSKVGAVWLLVAATLGFAFVLLSGAAALNSRLSPPATFTEFYILNPQGEMRNYPSRSSGGGTLNLMFGVRNLEGGPMTYHIANPGDNFETARALPLLQDGEVWEGTLTFPTSSFDEAGARFYLYRGTDRTPYRTLYLAFSP